MEHENCACRFTMRGDAVPEESLTNNDVEPLSLDACFERLHLQGRPVTPDGQKCHPSETLYNFSKIIKKFPCHNCHKIFLVSALSSVVDNKHPPKLKRYFRKQVLKNLLLNKHTHDSDIVALSMRSLRLLDLPERGIVEIVPKLELASATPAILTHYVNLWQPAKIENYLNIVKTLTTSLRNRFTENCHLEIEKFENVVFEALAIFFPIYIDAYTWDADYFLFNWMMVRKTKVVERWECCDRITRKFHDTLRWKSDAEFAVRHIVQMSVFTCALFDLPFPMIHQRLRPFGMGRFEGREESPDPGFDFKAVVGMEDADEAFKYYQQILIRLVEAVREVRVDSMLHSFGPVIKDKLDLISEMMAAIFSLASAGPREINIVTDLFDIFLLNIEEVLETKTLDHGREPSEYLYSEQSSDWTNIFNFYVQGMLDCIVRLLYKTAVKTINLNFLKAVVSLVRIKVSFELSDVKIIFDEIVSQNLYDRETLLKNGVAQAVYTNMMQLHDNCGKCAFVRDFVYIKILSILEPRDKIDFRTERGAELVASLPYVIRNKEKLVDVMYPEGFAILTSKLKHDQYIDSLYVVSTILQTEMKPQDVKQSEYSVCRKEPDVPVFENDRGTKIFVLDDGTKIRVETAPLVKNSSFFSSLLDGRFAEAGQEEIRIHDVTEFQFSFLVNFTILQPPAEIEQKFALDLQRHLDLYRVCDRFMFENLCKKLAHSASDLMTPKTLPEVYNIALESAHRHLRIACRDFALNTTTVCLLEWKRTIKYLLETINNKVLADDAMEWIELRCMEIKARVSLSKTPSI